MASKHTLSVCMIVKNEGYQLADALKSVQSFADEIIVVDTGSQDDTKAVAGQFTPHVYDFAWCDDFAAARNASLEKASCDYILWLDADDRFDEANQKRMRLLKEYFDGIKAFYLILQDMDTSGPSYAFYQLRCVPRRPEVRFKGRVHERLIVDGLVLANTDLTVQHHGYCDPGMFRRKIERNMHILEKEIAAGVSDEVVHYYLALSYQHLDKLREAAAAMQRCIDHLERQGRKALESPSESHSFPPPLLPDAYLSLGELYAKLGERHSALRQIIRGRSLAPKEAHIQFRAGCILQSIKEHIQAVHCFQEALDGEIRMRVIPAKPLTKGSIYVQMAYSFLCLGQKPMAMKCMKEAWRLGVDICESWEQLGLSALKAGELATAIHVYEAARQTGKLSTDSYCNLGLLYSKKGFISDALSCYEAVLQKEPAHTAAKANMAHLHLRLGHRKVASSMFTALLADGRDEADILLALAHLAVLEHDKAAIDSLVPSLGKKLGIGPPESPGSESWVVFDKAAKQLESEGKSLLASWAGEAAKFARWGKGSKLEPTSKREKEKWNL